MAKGWEVIFLADANDNRGTAESMAGLCGFPKDSTLVYRDPVAALEQMGERILESVVTGKLGPRR